MSSVSQRSRSPWTDELPPAAPELALSLNTDVAIAGAGLAGLTTAYLLQ